MKKSRIWIVVFMILFLAGCNNTESKENVYLVELDTNGDIVIDKDDITEEVSYYSYEYEGVSIGLLAVQDENGKIHIVINTCGSCGGSPNAYFIQVGNKLQCQNCGNLFLITELDNLISIGCNPIKIENIEEKDGKYIISHEELEQYKELFENWQGPKK